MSLIAVVAVLTLMVFAAPKKCNNGTDDDNDGLIDYPADPGCSSTGDNSETSTSLVCDNAADATNDRDTLADFRLSGGDPGCTSATDTSEIDGVCDDNVDDASDADSLADASDPGCTSTSDPSEIDGQCDDKSDNDGDTHTDYSASNSRDSKCVSFSDNDESPKDSCSDTDGGRQIFVQGIVSGDDESVPYNLTDVCADSITLTEYNCGVVQQDYAPLSTNFDCTLNATSCNNGACV